MSTIKDPNSLGAYLILPILFSGLALFKKSANRLLFVRPFRRYALAVMLLLQVTALFLTFSRGALLGLILSAVTLFVVVAREKLVAFIKMYKLIIILFFALFSFLFAQFSNTYIVQNLVLHSDESTVLADPNELRVSLAQQALEGVEEEPFGHGPGSAGLVAIKNPKGGILTENYYLQIAYEVGWLGLLLFVAILSIISYQLSIMSRKEPIVAVLFSALIGYLFYSLLIHLWSNEAVALQWWLLTGAILGLNIKILNPDK
jgi:hypothetical protein